MSINFKKEVIIGYLCFDYMKNGLESISKIPALLNTKQFDKEDDGITVDNNNKKREIK